MAALVLSFAGSALGGAFGAAGAVAGRLVGAVAGAVLDRALFGPRPPDGPRLKDLDVLSSTEGTPIPRVYGRARVAGQVIWATRLEEHASGGGKGGSPRTYSYTANLWGTLSFETGGAGRQTAPKPLRERQERATGGQGRFETLLDGLGGNCRQS